MKERKNIRWGRRGRKDCLQHPGNRETQPHEAELPKKGREHVQVLEQDLQIQQIRDADPVNMQIPLSQEIIETEASNWVNSHILELSNTYGVAFEGFEKETIALLMKIDERKPLLDNKGPGKAVSTPKSRGRSGREQEQGENFVFHF
ncbi:hypothetical protein KY285_001155 [Solanum tuberosum]|nr:hypothetical protein KY285_001155 [Solanum tuberosum]